MSRQVEIGDVFISVKIFFSGVARFRICMYREWPTNRFAAV